MGLAGVEGSGPSATAPGFSGIVNGSEPLDAYKYGPAFSEQKWGRFNSTSLLERPINPPTVSPGILKGGLSHLGAFNLSCELFLQL